MKNKFLVLALSVIVPFSTFAQTNWVKDGKVINTVTTAVPFLRINPDARAGGMGDVGQATPADINSVYSNPARLAFMEKDFGFAVSFTPWLKALVNDIYMGGLAGYYKVKDKQTIQMSLKYFSLGNITFTDDNGNTLGDFKPNEFSIDAGYSRKLGDNFALNATLRFVYSNLTNVGINSVPSFPGYAGAADIGWAYQKAFGKKKLKHDLLVGMNITNIGNKISYTHNSKNADYIPTNLAIGFGYTLNVDAKNAVGAYMDINRLLVPTPQPAQVRSENGGEVANPKYDENGDKIADWKQKSPIAGLFSSFADAPGDLYVDKSGQLKRTKGTQSIEELRETNIGIGLEYMYNKQFGVRFGYFYENPTKGNRQFITAGLTVKYSIVGLNFSYLIPTTIQRNPLDNTLRFSLLFDFAKGGKKSGENNTGVSLIDDGPKKKAKKAKDKEVTPAEEKPKEEPKKEEPVKEKKLEPIEPK
jgi:hypothetical protein